MKLVNFLVKLANESVQVELKNGTVVSGTIISVSPSMNINLKNVKMTVKHRNPTELEYITVRGNQIRMVLLPDELNLDSILSDAVFKPPKKLSTAPPAALTSKAPKRPVRGGRSKGF